MPTSDGEPLWPRHCVRIKQCLQLLSQLFVVASIKALLSPTDGALQPLFVKRFQKIVNSIQFECSHGILVVASYEHNHGHPLSTNLPHTFHPLTSTPLPLV